MRYSYLLITFLLLACVKSNKEKTSAKGAIEKQEIENAVETVADEIEAVAQPSEHVTTTFKEELLKLKLKTVPLVDSTSFDNLIDKGDYQNINTEALQLAKVYKNWEKLKSNYRIIDAYRLKLSKGFYTVMITALQSDEEIESKLINYDLEGNVIASEMVAYDSKTEDWMRTKSTIETDRITINYQYKVSKETGYVKIEPNGKFRMLGLSDIFYELVIDELNIDKSKLIPSLQAFKTLPNRPNEAIVVIPEIVEGSEEEHYFTLNTHIAYVNIENRQVLFHYFESAETNGWTSDAIMLTEIVIDTAPYTITENERAFGVKTHFVGSSRVNPYENESLSLFIIANNNLQKVLHNFEIIDNGGEWDGNCHGEFITEKRTLIISEEKNNGYFDILVKHKITNNIAFEDENGDCKSKDTITTKTSVLKFDGKTYK
ncbi:hypothetical protein C8N26_2729 [Tenacibaculum lutimaris]|uniref:Lipoprotein n=1 Tax=Tenacibaculum lutimaris TaxID=285258 RepID=A0A420DY48_9FLAO|nr:hypothetical protein [Tenacibaculum lutimaris]RKF02740.1 hypothetical protein C8N26_2729 [Tenacibaculum lutimaris]